MALWNKNFSYLHFEFIKAIFAYCYIEVEPEICWFPHLDTWKGRFETKFKYLYFTEIFDIEKHFSASYDGFFNQMTQIREKIAKEYHYYFNELWC